MSGATDRIRSWQMLRGSVRNPQIFPSARGATAIVGPKKSLGVDFTDIQQAINHVNDLGGGSVVVKPGRYYLSQDIPLYSNISLIGQDDDSVILDFNGTTKGIRAVGTLADPLTNIHISGIQIKNSYNITEGAIYFEWVKDSSITENLFTDNWDASGSDGRDIYLQDDCERILIERNRSEGSGYFYYGGGALIHVMRNHVINCNKSGIYGLAQSMAKSLIYGNYIQNPTEDGIHQGTNGPETTIDSNIIWSAGGYGIYVDTFHTQIVNNIITAASSSGNHLIFLDSDTDYSIITGNQITNIDALKSGIYLSAGSDRNIISNNFIEGSGFANDVGITVSDASCNNNIITSNVLTGLTTTVSDAGTGTVQANNVT